MKLLTLCAILFAAFLTTTLAAPRKRMMSPDKILRLRDLRKRTKTCSANSVCSTVKIPTHATHTCSGGLCHWACSAGYSSTGTKCTTTTKKSTTTTSKPKTTTTTSKKTTTTTTTSKKTTTTTTTSKTTTTTAAPSSTAYLTNQLGAVKAFTGTNTGSIMSWFDTDSTRDQTNGHSWCYFPYQQTTPGFAISLAVMLSATGGDATAARKMFCGLEAVLTNPVTGKTETLIVADAFSAPRTTTSVDIIKPFFDTLYGTVVTDDYAGKQIVIQNGSWKFTGRRAIKYQYDNVGDP